MRTHPSQSCDVALSKSLTHTDPPPTVYARLLYKQMLVVYDPLQFINKLIERYGDYIYYRGLFRCYVINNPESVSYTHLTLPTIA